MNNTYEIPSYITFDEEGNILISALEVVEKIKAHVNVQCIADPIASTLI
jgi:hypothetical protein